ncbi:hypothetical protein HYH02_013736 [Chlamydomonas schloesseri]|uniref:Uncharacterized protein n=1 Tax=Chlamydomonas schloesseri TaxID=2026947 RepID=A0A835SNP2_9CHLO|nr:hypothetical protein HYH02_013736 [Chlamydomonas schloesseri]|eukprot:KAG2430374.1 hypothetical protein HYH02_013736 [Chlamydomonas schloesseri]
MLPPPAGMPGPAPGQPGAPLGAAPLGAGDPAAAAAGLGTEQPAQQQPPAPGSLFGLAAELAGQAPPTMPAPAPPPAAARLAPARLGPARGPPPPPDPFSLADQARRNPRSAQQLARSTGTGEVPYGLALELLNGAAAEPGSLLNPATAAAAEQAQAARAADRAARRGLGPAFGRLGGAASAAAAPPPPGPPGALPVSGGGAAAPYDAMTVYDNPLGLASGSPPPGAVLPQSLQQPPLDPFTVMEMAANAQGLPEPDYGLVAELRNRAPPDPFANEYGLAAEAARRRSRSPSPLGRGAGRLPPLRARRRLDPVLAPGEADLADEMAARQRQAALAAAEPFSAAARADGQDPFALAGEQLKVPREMLDPYLPSQQQVPGEHEQLLVAGGAADGVSDDDELYGLAKELGVDLETARRIRAERRAQGLDAFGRPLAGGAAAAAAAAAGLPEQVEPPGPKYIYDEDTGMIVTTEGGQGDGGRVARQYIEDEVTGRFYKLASKRRRFFAWFRRKEPAVMDDDSDEEDARGFRGSLRSTVNWLSNFFCVIGLFMEGLLGGLALVNFFMTYMLYSRDGLRRFLAYYAPIAQDMNRIYYSLLVLSIISSTSRLARDKLRGWGPRGLYLAAVDYSQILCYLVAYVASVLCTPLDDELTYESDRNPGFWQLTWASGFKRRFSTWNLLNVVRTIFIGIAWCLACYQLSPAVYAAALRAEMRAARRQHALMAAGAAGPAGLALVADHRGGGGGGGGAGGAGGEVDRMQRKTA